MKQRLILLAILISTVSTVSFAQLAVYNGKRPIVVGKNEIRHVNVTGNIGVVLRKERGDGINLSMDKSLTDKVKITRKGDKLYISSDEKLPVGEHLVVYAWFDELESLTLRGNVMVASVGVLNYSNLSVNIDDHAKVSLRTTGKIRMHAPDNTPLIQREQYHSVVVGER